MAFERGESVERSSDTWNVAQGYTNLKILKPLVELDKLIKIAIYGCENIEESLMFAQNPQLKNQLRVEALQRIVDSLRELFENSEFAMNKSGTPAIFTKLQERTKVVESVLSVVVNQNIDMRTGQTEMSINESHFNICLNELRAIKQAIPKPLNDNSLIFPSGDEINLDAIKQEIIEAG